MSQKHVATDCPFEETNVVSHKIISYMRKKLKIKYGNAKSLRIFHAKSIGLVKATLEVPNNSDVDLKVGLFKEPGTYDAWIRFTNGSSSIGADNEKSFRGMAIKILKVPGPQHHNHDLEENVQDIILTTGRNFVPGTAALSLYGVKTLLGNFWEQASSFLHVISVSPRGVIPFLKSVDTSPNVLEEMYYSGTPYAFGEKAVKWHVRPMKTITSAMPENPGDDFLRERLLKDLSADAPEDIAFKLMVQFHENEETEPIDDSTVIWKTKFKLVAIIKIPRQNFNTHERYKIDENMYFNVGHSMAEHAPLGSVNMVRKKVYEVLAKERLKHP